MLRSAAVLLAKPRSSLRSSTIWTTGYGHVAGHQVAARTIGRVVLGHALHGRELAAAAVGDIDQAVLLMAQGHSSIAVTVIAPLGRWTSARPRTSRSTKFGPIGSNECPGRQPDAWSRAIARRRTGRNPAGLQ